MTRKISTIVLSLFFVLPNMVQCQIQQFREQPIFENGKDGYACFRIPAVIKAANGDLLAIAEGRVNGCSDYGNLDLVMRRSEDNGQTWEPLEVIFDNGEWQAGNPAPVVDLMDPDYPQGRIFLFFNTGNNHEGEVRKGNGIREVHYLTSEDHGETWSEPVNITLSVHRPKQPGFNPAYNFTEDWRSYANTPGHALQLSSGRLFIPANHSVGEPLPGFNEYRAHAYYSDDHGETFQLSEFVAIPSSNESIAVQLTDGRILQNSRHQNGESKNRIVSISSDGGMTWDTSYIDTNLPSPVCQASMINYTTPDGKAAVLFSNPNSQVRREKMTIRMSLDDGQSWPVSREIRRGNSAYSDLVVQEDGDLGILYEHGNDGGIHYAHFNYAWLVGGE